MTDSPANTLGRIAALLGGLAILLIAAVSSLGLVLAAPIGMWIVHRVRRGRRRGLGGWESWIAAVSGTTVALLIVAGVIAAMVPSGTWRQIRQVADSASVVAAQRPPPAWISRVVPGAGRYAAPSASASVGFSILGVGWGLGFTVGFMGAFIGTVGWAGAMLLVFYASGRWFRAAALPLPDPEAV